MKHTMKHACKTLLALAAATLPPAAFAGEEEPAPGIIESINMFTPAPDAPAYKVKASEKLGTEWGVDVAYAYWGSHRQPAGTPNHTHYALLHAQLNQRLWGERNSTWLRAEFSGSWKLNGHTGKEYPSVFDTASATEAHADAMFGPHAGIIPELALMQYFAGGHACVIAGMVNLTNYFDAVGIANDSFANFTNTGFVNSTILPLVDSNLGVVLQAEFGKSDYAMLAVSRTGSRTGYNPFRDGQSGYCVVGEYGHLFLDGDLAVRLNPFVNVVDKDDTENGRTQADYGLTGSIEYTPCDYLTAYMRGGIAAKSHLGNGAEFSIGANLHLIPSRKDDFLGIAYGVFKGAKSTEAAEEEDGGDVHLPFHNRESVLEIMYSFQVNDYMKLVPHIQYIHNAASREGHGDETLFGFQTVFSF